MKDFKNYTLGIYKNAAYSLLKHTKTGDPSEIIRIFSPYKNIIDLQNDRLSLSKILDCFALEKGHENWESFKKKHEYIAKKLRIERKKFKKTNEKMIDKIWDYEHTTYWNNVYDELDSDKFTLNNYDLSNLYIGLTHTSLIDDIFFGTTSHWIKLINCKLEKCIFLGHAFAFCNIKNTSFNNSIFSGIPLKIRNGYVYFKGPLDGRLDCEYSYFNNCSLINCLAANSYLKYAAFDCCNLSNSIFTASNAFQMSLSNCNLDNADLNFLDGSPKILEKSTIRGTNLYMSDVFFSNNVIADNNTVFSDGTKILKKNNQNDKIEITMGSSEMINFKCPYNHI